MTAELIHYRLPGRTSGVHVGAHKGRHYGPGMEFLSHQSLWRLPEPKRIDIRASLCNPWQELVVRVFRQRASISVVVLADLSASLGDAARLEWMAAFTHTLGLSANKTGDRFGFIGCDEKIRGDFFYPVGKKAGMIASLSQRLRQFKPVGRHSDGLLQANFHLPQKSLVFLLSDFYFDSEFLDGLLAGLAGHFVVPVVMAIPQPEFMIRRYAIAQLEDAETGKIKFVISTPAFRDRYDKREREHVDDIALVCRKHGAKPLLIKSDFRARDITNYFFPMAGK